MTVGAILGLLGSTPVLHWLGGRRAIAAALLLITAALAAMGLALIVGSIPLVAVARFSRLTWTYLHVWV